MDTIYTVSEVSKYLKISESKLYYMVQHGEIPHIKIGKNVRILEADLIAWLKERRRPEKQLGFRFPE